MEVNVIPPPPISATPIDAPAETPVGVKRPRNSNLELYRIIVMLLIVAHHYVVNSGLFQVLESSPLTPSSAAMLLFGAWGKTGINCFVMITGWFMCRSTFTWRKLLKLYAQITFYAIIIYAIFCFTGHEAIGIRTAALKLFPVRSLATDFVGCFLVFYLLIPFLNILVQNMDRKLHATLLAIMLVVYTLLPTLPAYYVSFNYVTWFCVLYFIASYIRFYGLSSRITHRTWGWLTLLLIFAASASVIGMVMINKAGYIKSFQPYFFISDSNKIFALLIGVSSFMYFKDLRIPHSRLINTLGAATFGVLLIHANSNAMRQWLWRETVDCAGHYGDSILWTLCYAAVTILIVFVVCAGIDWFRGRLFDVIESRIDNIRLHRGGKKGICSCQD